MNPAKRLNTLLIALFGASLALTLLLLAFMERGNFEKLKNLSERVAGFDKQRVLQEFAEKTLEAMAPLAAQAEGSALDIDEQVKAASADGVVKALFATGRPGAGPSRANRKGSAETLPMALARLAGPKKGLWLSAEIVDKDGWVSAYFPPEQKPAGDFKKD